MPAAEFFARFGLFVQRGFASDEMCARIRGHAAEASWKPASVHLDSGNVLVAEEVRRTLNMRVPEPERVLKERFTSLRPVLERHFESPLTGFEDPQLLRYREDGFFVPHRDSAEETNGHDYLERRRISMVLFLNGQSDEPGADGYSGGSLILYGLMPDPKAKEVGFPVVGEPGVLIAFRSELLHEVKPVTRGERYSVVTWYY